MVTRTVILVTASEAAAFAATSTLLSSSSSAAAADSIISNAPAEQINLDEELQTNLFNYSSYTKRAQDPSPGGLVQLCCLNGCLNAVDFEKRGGGLCYIHLNQKGPTDDGEHSDSEDEGKIRGVTAAKYGLDDEVGKKRDRPLEDSISNNKTKKRQRVDAFVLDLSDVPPQSPIPNSAGHIKEGASKYTGVTFNKQKNKWQAQVIIDGKLRLIGCYEREEEAAIDYARAVFKYRGQGAFDKTRERRALDNAREKDSFIIDLSDVPPQSPVPKSAGHIKEGASKYKGVSFDKKTSKWHAQIMIAGKSRHIGYYENEEEAAVDYARAVFKYKGQGHWDRSHDQLGGAAIGGNKAKKRQKDAFAIDLTDVPSQSPISKCAGTIKGASKYAGVTFDKQTNKWRAQISIEGKQRFIGSYDNEKKAAAYYARAVFKYKGRGALDKARERSALDKEREQHGEVCGVTTADEGLCDRHLTHGNKYGLLDNEVGKRDRTSGGSIGGNKTKKCKKVDAFAFDLSDVPPQPPIPKSGGYIKEGASKYAGVSFNKSMKKWHAQITIEGKKRHIGNFENEEEAAVDYARAVFKYRGQGALDKAREQNSIIIDLSDVPPQSPIPKSAGHIREGASKYTGVHFNKLMNKWQAQIDIKGKNRTIGSYENEEEAAVDYARAVFKYKGQGELEKGRERRARDLPE